MRGRLRIPGIRVPALEFEDIEIDLPESEAVQEALNGDGDAEITIKKTVTGTTTTVVTTIVRKKP